MNERAWVLQPSGLRLDLLNPSPFGWEDEDLAVGLAQTFRWGGQSRWDRPMSVAQHSLLVLELRRQAEGGQLSRMASLRELLHDAEEGLIRFDPISPLKPVLGEAFAALFDRLSRAVFTRYNVAWWEPGEKVAHKRADWLAAASEAVHVAGWSRDEVVNVLGIQTVPTDDDPLVRVYGGRAWEPWAEDVAVERFLGRLHELVGVSPALRAVG